jgi:hypothetical protein
MQFTHDIGIVATKAELDALLAFSKDTNDASITIRVRAGKLLAIASCGRSSVYHHGEAWDGAGEPATERCIWQVNAELLRRINKGLGNDEELLLSIDDVHHLTHAVVRTIEDNETKQKIDLDSFVTSQLELSLFDFLPSRPDRNNRSKRTPEFMLGFSQLDLIKKVTKAASTDAVRFFVESSPNTPVYVEVDQIKRLADEEQARWVCVFVPIKLDEDFEERDDSPLLKAAKEFKRKAEDSGYKVSVTTPDGKTTTIANPKGATAKSEPEPDDDVSRELKKRGKKPSTKTEKPKVAAKDSKKSPAWKAPVASKPKKSKPSKKPKAPASPALEDLEDESDDGIIDA